MAKNDEDASVGSLTGSNLPAAAPALLAAPQCVVQDGFCMGCSISSKFGLKKIN